MSGRPNEGRVKLTCYVLPLTARRIAFLVDKTKKPDAANTQGKVVDSQFGAFEPVEEKVAGAGPKEPSAQHGRDKQKQSRAKRANFFTEEKAIF